MPLIPLFPLPNVVLLPRTHLPLHIFEERYRLMMAHALKNGRRMAVAHLKPGYEDEYFAAPKVYRVITIARILWEERLPNGRYNLLLEGEARAEIIEEVQTEPFRVARYQELVDELPQSTVAEAQQEGERCAALAEVIAANLPTEVKGLRNLMNVHQHPGIVADVVSAMLVTDPYARQSILEETHVLRRIRLVCIQLELLRRQLAAGEVELRLSEEG